MPKKYLFNPFNVLYQDDCLVSDRPEIQEIIEYAAGLEDQIEGDFNISYLLFEFGYNQLAFVRNGLLLAKVKFMKLYKDFGDGTFATFCKEHLHKTRWQINDIITSSRIVMELIYCGFDVLPANISQAIALKSLSGEELFDAWKQVVEEIPPDQITYKSIRQLLFPPTEDDRAVAKIQLPAVLHEEVHREAAEQGWSIPQLIAAMLHFFVSGGTAPILQGEETSPNLGANSLPLKPKSNTKGSRKKQVKIIEDLERINVKMGLKEVPY